LAIDIDEKIKAEQALRASEQEARIAGEVPAMIFLRTTEGIVYTHEHIHKYIGVGSDELRGRGWLKYVHPEDQERLFNSLNDQTRSRDESAPIDLLYRLRGADGTYRWFRTRAEPYLCKEGDSYC
jgi:PAS domain S-box-containing protein